MQEYAEPIDMDRLLDGVTLAKLKAVFDEVLKRQEDKIDPIRSKFGKIEKEEVELPEKMRFVEEYARRYRTFSFRQLLEKQKSKMQVVVTFLAVLEMMKTGALQVVQEHTFSEIMITSMI